MGLNETYSTVQENKHFCDVFPLKDSLKQGEALSPLLLNFAFVYVIRMTQVNQDGLKLNGPHQFWFKLMILTFRNRVSYI
jgi:hypothetical protein